MEASGDNGFIYVSFGGEADIAAAPLEFQKIFFRVFAETNVRFLWKRSRARPKEMPDNVYMANWMPQKDILGN